MLGHKSDNDNHCAPKEGTVMRIFIFKSETRPDLRAFSDDMAGSRLPEQFRPWRAIGAVAPDRDPPYKLSRAKIETAVSENGFQLWRFSKKS
jgi:hypothetical protein